MPLIVSETFLDFVFTAGSLVYSLTCQYNKLANLKKARTNIGRDSLHHKF
jgi:hypothetical protein